jgi:hypothetical protein
MPKARKRRCHGKTRAGKACRRAPSRGRRYCPAHDPTLAEVERFGSPEQAARAGAAPKPRAPKLREALAAKVEERAEEIIAAYVEALAATRGVIVRIGDGQDELVERPDHAARVRAADALLDRVHGRPKQQTEISGPDGGPVPVGEAIDLSRFSDEDLATLEEILARAEADG